VKGQIGTGGWQTSKSQKKKNEKIAEVKLREQEENNRSCAAAEVCGKGGKSLGEKPGGGSKWYASNHTNQWIHRSLREHGPGRARRPRSHGLFSELGKEQYSHAPQSAWGSADSEKASPNENVPRRRKPQKAKDQTGAPGGSTRHRDNHIYIQKGHSASQAQPRIRHDDQKNQDQTKKGLIIGAKSAAIFTRRITGSRPKGRKTKKKKGSQKSSPQTPRRSIRRWGKGSTSIVVGSKVPATPWALRGPIETGWGRVKQGLLEGTAHGLRVLVASRGGRCLKRHKNSQKGGEASRSLEDSGRKTGKKKKNKKKRERQTKEKKKKKKRVGRVGGYIRYVFRQDEGIIGQWATRGFGKLTVSLRPQ